MGVPFRRKAASKSAAALRLKSDFTLLTLIKVGPRKIFSMRGPRARTCSLIMWAHHWWNPLLPAPADSPHSGGWLPLTELSFGGAVSEKGGLEVLNSLTPKPLDVIIVVNIKWIINKDEEQRL